MVGRYGTFDKDQSTIIGIHQRKGLTYLDVPSVLKSLVDTVCINVEYGSTVFTDDYRAYDQLEELGLHTRA